MTYVNRLYDLWYYDPKARQRLQISTIVISFAYGAFNSLALKRPEKQITLETLCLMLFLTIAFSAYYCFRPAALRVSSVPFGWVRQNPRVFASGLFAVVALLSLSFATHLSSVRVALIDLQLRKVAHSIKPLTPYYADEMNRIIAEAQSNQLALSPRLVNVAADRLVDASVYRPESWHTALEYLSYRTTLNKETQAYPTSQCIAVGGLAGINISVEASELNGCTQALDHIAWTNVVFKNSNIVYHGGPTKLENVEFINCRFIMDYTPPSRELAKSLLASNNVSAKIPSS